MVKEESCAKKNPVAQVALKASSTLLVHDGFMFIFAHFDENLLVQKLQLVRTLHLTCLLNVCFVELQLQVGLLSVCLAALVIFVLLPGCFFSLFVNTSLHVCIL